jgi:hypothetical protein
VKRALATVVLGLLTAAWSATPAGARWGSAAPGAGIANATTIAAPGTLSASCGLLTASVKLDWVASPTPWVTQYEVRWGTNASAPSQSQIVTGRTFTTPGLSLGTWYFTVRAAKGGWRSPTSNQPSKLVVSVLGLGVACV